LPSRSRTRGARPPRRPADSARLPQNSWQVEAAGGHEERVRTESAHLDPGRIARRLTGPGTDRVAAGGPDGLGDPVTGQHRRREPFDHRHARARRGSWARNPSEPASQLISQRRPALPDSAGRRDRSDVPKDVVEVGGTEGHEARPRRRASEGGCDLGVGHRANLAGLLGDHDVWSQVAKELLVELVDRKARRHDPADFGVDLIPWQGGVDARAREHRQLRDVRWKIALVGASHETPPQAERADDLRRCGKQRDDPHSPAPSKV
jgi:hypothetical protein